MQAGAGRGRWGLRGEWPLVGRPRELAALRDAIAEPGGAGAILVGAAGVGKTRLASAALAAAADAGLVTERITATEATATLPFGALASLLPARSLGDRIDLLRHSADALAARGAGRVVVLMVDDVQLLDPGSAALLHQVATTGRAVLVATLRAGTSPPDEITALWKDEMLERIEVGPLSDDDVAELLHVVLEGPVARPTIRELIRASGGTPLYLRELVLAGLDDGRLRQLEGVWQLEGRAPLPETVLDLIRSRLDALAQDERAVVELVAFGEPVEIEVIEQLTPPGVASALERAGLLSTEESGRRVLVRLTHPLQGEVIRADAPYLAARRVRSKLAAALEALGVRQWGDALRIGAWRLHAGEPLAPDLALEAAVQARARFDFDLAERCASAAVAAGVGLAAELALAEIISASGRADEGEKLLADLAERVSGDDDVAAVATAHFDNLIFLQGRYPDAFAVASAAEAKLSEVGRRAEVTARRALVLVGGGYVDDALALVSPLLDRVDGPARAWCGTVVAFCCVANGEFERGDAAMALAESAIADEAWAPAAPDPAFVVFVRTQLALYRGRLAEAEALALKGLHSDTLAAPDQSRAWLAWSLATIARLQGRPRTAARRAQQALALLRGPWASDIVRLAGNELALARAMLGDAEGAAAALPTRMDVPGISGVVLTTQLAEAWVLAARGQIADAASLVEDVAGQQHGGGTAVYEALALIDVARLGRARVAAPRLAQLASAIEGELVPAGARFASALASRDPSALDASADELAALGLSLHAAEAAVAASAAHHRQGNPRKAAAADGRATALVAACQGASTPGLVRSDTLAALSPREREAAGLAVAGLSNRQIAERLGLSKRTVDNALQRVYDKLGLAGRPDLAKALGVEAKVE